MSAGDLKDKRLAFNRLLHDLHQDSLHAEVEEGRDILPKMSHSAAIATLRNRLKKRYRRSRLAPTRMYLPRAALTAAILLSCAVALVYIRRLKEMEFIKTETEKQQIDSLMKLINTKDTLLKK
jgi:hypothetical protein